MLITTTEELCSAVLRMKEHKVLAIDTEFMREKTYFAKLCLIQIASAEEVVLIDPLSDIDLTVLTDILCDTSITKVFHAGGQDLEILYQLLDVPTAPIFDTQSAAALMGYPDQVGYGALVQGVIGVQLGKADSFTDWARRPLTPAQIAYAADDVIYLLQMYPLMVEALEKADRLAWLDAEFSRRVQPDQFIVKPREQFRRLKKVSALNRRQLAVAREIAAWRESEAMEIDIPKRWVISDETVIEIARRQPATRAELEGIRGIGNHALRKSKEIVEAVERGKSIPESDLPELTKKRKLAMDIDASVDLMMCLVRQRAKDNNIAVTQLASRTMLEQFVSDPTQPNELTGGWRKSMVGDELVELVSGLIRLSLDNGTLVIERIHKEALDDI